MVSCSINAQDTFIENPQLTIISFYNYKHLYLITSLNLALTSLHIVALEITRTVPLDQNK